MHVPTYEEFKRISIFVKWTLTGNMIVSSILFPYVIFVILTKSTKEMGSCKILLVLITCVSFLLTIVYFLWQPVPIFPFLGGISVGPIEVFGSSGTAMMIPISLACQILLTATIVAGLSHQFHLLKPTKLSMYVFQSPKTVIIFFAIYTAAIQAATIILMEIAYFTTDMEYDFTHTENQAFRELITEVHLKEETFYGIYMQKSGLQIASTITGYVFLIFHMIVILWYNVQVFKTILKTKGIVSDKTYLIQKKFLKAFVILSSSAVFLIFGPLILAMTIFMFLLYETVLGIWCFNIVPLGIPVLYILILVLIHPYRSYTIKKFRSIYTSKVKERKKDYLHCENKAISEVG
ncbi:hypothetical protein FO519_002925 [Halicephalobus sp. NKZ332]|nr:hypothetical protein FO519_002925 [Halicephalobus sp. NKZ332]